MLKHFILRSPYAFIMQNAKPLPSQDICNLYQPFIVLCNQRCTQFFVSSDGTLRMYKKVLESL